MCHANKALIALTVALLSGCGGSEKRPEVVEKFRAIGVASNPVIAKPGDNVELTFYVAGIQGRTYNLNYLKDTSASFSVPVLATEVANSQSENKLGNLSIYSFKANAAVDATSKTLLASIAATGKARLRYGVQMVPTTEPEDEKIVGDVLVYPPGSPETAYQAPTISFVNIANGATVGAGATQTLETKITSTIQESYRIGWFVSAGEIKNRRAKNTEWKAGGTGEQTLIVTARGMTSGAFVYSAIKVTVQ